MRTISSRPPLKKSSKKYKLGVPYFMWDAKNRRNEALDCRVYSLAAIRILQQHRGINLELLAKARPAPDNLPDPEAEEEKNNNRRPVRRSSKSVYLQR